jgi:hypothetical protein
VISAVPRRVVLAAALLTGGCDAEPEPGPPGEILPVPKLEDDPAKLGAYEPPADDTVYLDNGFLPDPHVVEGTTLGTVEASSLADGCRGWVATDADQVLEARGTFARLRVLAHSEDDVALLIERSDGTFLCSDDDEGTDPVVAASFPSGRYRIRVAAARPNEEVSYLLGFSELAGVLPSALLQ